MILLPVHHLTYFAPPFCESEKNGDIVHTLDILSVPKCTPTWWVAEDTATAVRCRRNQISCSDTAHEAASEFMISTKVISITNLRT